MRRKIITISREFGAGGSAIGTEVARRLGYEFYDKALILKAAREAGIGVEDIMSWDERVPVDFGFAQSLFHFYSRPLNERVYEAQRLVIRKFGEKGNCVIVGRNANAILKEFDNTLHVFVHASPYWRTQHMKEKMPDTSTAKLTNEMRTIDRARRRYCAHFTNTEFGVAEYYDLCLSTSTLGIGACVEVICQLAGEK